MFRSLGLAVAALFLTGFVTAAFAQPGAQPGGQPGTQPAPAPPKAPPASKEHISYSVGLDVGSNLLQNEVDLDVELIVRGIKDALAKSKPAITNEQIRGALDDYNLQVQKKALERFKALGVKNKKEGEEFLAKNKSNKEINSLNSGLQVQILKSGKGPSPKKTDVVKVNYEGKFIDGTTFDSSPANQPAEFPVQDVINGWSEALTKMKVGDKWKLFVPSDLAYGEQGSPPYIGPNAVLIFEVELLDIVPPANLPAPGGK